MNNTAKQEAIRKAWLEFLSEEDFNKLILDEEGFSNYQCRRYIHQSRWNDLYSKFTKNTKSRTGSDLIYRPKSIEGIENNNGWISIDSEGDLPKKLMLAHVFDDDGDITQYIFGIDEKIDCDLVKTQGITHYQPIVKPEKPIY